MWDQYESQSVSCAKRFLDAIGSTVPHWRSQEWWNGATPMTDCESDAQDGLRSTLLESRTNKGAGACALNDDLHASERQEDNKLNVRNSMLWRVGYKWSRKFKLEIPTEVHCSRDHHFKLSETFTSCISDESIVLSYIQYLSIPMKSSSAYLCSQR